MSIAKTIETIEAERARAEAENEQLRQEIDRLRAVLHKIVCGPNGSPYGEPWSRTEAMCALAFPKRTEGAS